MSELNKIALQILSNGKGILAADESTATMTKRLDSVKVHSDENNRLLFRQTLFSSSSMSECIGGVILYDETIRQRTSNGKTIPELINSSGSLAGIKVDTGAKILAGSKEEKITEGLDDLRERLKDYYELGARFTKWRAVYLISDKYPSKLNGFLMWKQSFFPSRQKNNVKFQTLCCMHCHHINFFSIPFLIYRGC